MGWACSTCGRELTTERGMRQHHTKVHGEPLPNRVCEGCGIEFYDSKAQRTFCDDCNPNAGEHNGNWKGGKETAVCVLCGDKFEYYPSDKKGMYCPECVAESDEFLGEPHSEVVEIERVRRDCRNCGEEMTVLQTELERARSILFPRMPLPLDVEGRRGHLQSWLVKGEATSTGKGQPHLPELWEDERGTGSGTRRPSQRTSAPLRQTCRRPLA